MVNTAKVSKPNLRERLAPERNGIIAAGIDAVGNGCESSRDSIAFLHDAQESNPTFAWSQERLRLRYATTLGWLTERLLDGVQCGSPDTNLSSTINLRKKNQKCPGGKLAILGYWPLSEGKKRRPADSQAPLLKLNQIVPYLTGSPPSRHRMPICVLLNHFSPNPNRLFLLLPYLS